MIDIPQILFTFAVQKKKLIINLFWIGYYALIVFSVLGQYFLYTNNRLFLPLYELGENAGKVAIVFFILTGIPGIVRRFRLNLRVSSLLMLFRRQLGLSGFFFVLFHYFMVRFDLRNILPRLSLFELMGFSAFCLLLTLVMTSNDLSVRKLGKWWTRIHALFYIIVLLIFLHVALQGISIWSLSIGILASLEVISYIYYYSTKPSKISPMPQHVPSSD